MSRGTHHRGYALIPEAEVLQREQFAGGEAVFGGIRAGQLVGEVAQDGATVGFFAGEPGLFSHELVAG